MDKEDNEYGDFRIEDPKFTGIVVECIKDSIMKGASSKGAAAEAGITVRRFKKWCSMDENFRDMVYTWQEEYYGSMMQRTNSDIEEIADREKRARMTMKYLQNTSPEFGRKKIDITEREVDAVEGPPGAEDETSKKLIEEAERVANDD